MIDELIINEIESTYGSFERPTWDLINKRYEKKPYAKLTHRLSSIGSVKETTDLNDDVSVVLAIDGVCPRTITLYLSLVGRFACIRMANKMVDFASGKWHPCLDDLKHLLDDNGIRVLTPNELKMKVHFNEQPVSLFNVLFSDEYIDDAE